MKSLISQVSPQLTKRYIRDLAQAFLKRLSPSMNAKSYHLYINILVPSCFTFEAIRLLLLQTLKKD